ncbi:MAG: glycosyltransferase family 4 protein [Candidatus Omnitrophica bacterium]|nr:glycosyltransferase family 4 protein [Candidatus Omnitrophota bacterium]MDD5553338.1 glycosyltransferase family 4 protein [Candidatus Omnitrophota bacterium]
MNILMVHPHDIFSSEEPWTVRIVYLAGEFVKNGHSVKLVYFPLYWKGQGPQQLSNGIIAIPFSRRHGPHIFISNIIKMHGLAKWADIIHFQKCFYHAAIPALISAFLRNKPLHYDWDDWEVKIYEVSTKPGIMTRLIHVFLNTLEMVIPKICDTVSCASERLKTECENLGVDESRIFEAHVGADLTHFRPDISGETVRENYAIKNPLILYLGQLHGGQYVELFIEAAAELINDHRQDISFMIVGGGYRSKELKEMAEKLKLNGKLIFTGALPHLDIPKYIAAADICVACFEENEVTMCKSPLKIVEYLASGKAIVASDVGEVPNMLRGAGILTEPGNAGSLASGILKILRDSDLKDDLQKLARKRAEEKYNWEVTAENIMRAYKKSAFNID